MPTPTPNQVPQGFNRYPTREQIELAMPLYEPSQDLQQALDVWRREGRGTPLTHERLQDLVRRLWIFTTAREKPAPQVVVSSVTGNNEYCYMPATNTINLGMKPSIISTLHEMAHAVYGIEELPACAFSIALFKAVYPRSFAKLEWKGHMLVKPGMSSTPITSMEAYPT